MVQTYTSIPLIYRLTSAASKTDVLSIIRIHYSFILKGDMKHDEHTASTQTDREFLKK